MIATTWNPRARPASTFSLTDLARLADVTPRTIRYYISQGLLAAPTGSGQAARYGEGHLARLRLIRRLQREHLPLAEIRSRLVGLSDEDVRLLVADETRGAATADRFGDRLHPAGARRSPDVGTGGAGQRRRRRCSCERRPHGVGSRRALAPSAPPPPPATDAEPDRSTWERVALTPDVELHLRRPLDRQTNKRVDRLIRIARELLEED